MGQNGGGERPRRAHDGFCDRKKVAPAVGGENGAKTGLADTRALWAGEDARTGLPAHALVEVELRFGIEGIEFGRLVEHLPRRWSAARR